MYSSIRRKWEKILKYKRDGVLLTQICDAIKGRTIYRVSGILMRLRGKVQEQYEKKRGLDFSAPLPGMYAAEGERRDYWPSEKKYVQRALAELDFHNKLNFLDVGCGKGYVLYLAAAYPFARIAGIEYSEDVFSILKRNMAQLRRTDIALFNADARDFDAYGEYDVIYFFNPFGEKIMSDVIESILNQMRKEKEYTIIYYNPVCADLILQTGIFKLVRDLPIARGCKIHIYRGKR
ncbi:class I SAM-dependent methyltransferase [uncultured Desulfovibrio sp.]|uniref:class I SAM-dependent methyltransferase n=1 Tax=uncultured Desulfovibrio sp. TaxID=167968 RepID=UPI0026375770|nr:class I SAM-dependent methyltransferase [uncultured Desulfovibrio sp.]